METRNYELMFVVSPELTEETLEAVLQRVRRYLDVAEAQVVSLKSWGLRRLAYTVKGQREGRYYLALFRANSAMIADLDRSLRLVEGVLRHLITRMETEMPEPAPEEPQAPTPEPVVETVPEAAPEPTPEPAAEPESDTPSDSE